MAEREKRPGWYVDEIDPRYQRYWNGADWSPPQLIPPAQTGGITTGKIALGVALGIGVAILGVVVVNGVTGPSDLECSTQRLEYSMGDRAAWQVHEDCR